MRKHPSRQGRLIVLFLCLVPLAALAVSKTYQYEYDDAGRLIRVAVDKSEAVYEYDAASTVTLKATGAAELIFNSGFEGGSS